MFRGRKEEEGAPLSYLKSLHQCYEDWLIDKKFGDDKLPPVLVFDANQDLPTMEKLFHSHENILRGLEPLTNDENKQELANS